MSRRTAPPGVVVHCDIGGIFEKCAMFFDCSDFLVDQARLSAEHLLKFNGAVRRSSAIKVRNPTPMMAIGPNSYSINVRHLMRSKHASNSSLKLAFRSVSKLQLSSRPSWTALFRSPEVCDQLVLGSNTFGMIQQMVASSVPPRCSPAGLPAKSYASRTYWPMWLQLVVSEVLYVGHCIEDGQ